MKNKDQKIPLYSNDEGFLLALIQKRKEIAEGLEYKFFDNDVTGAKFTLCSWGLHQDDLQWYKIAFYLGDDQHCPLRTDPSSKSGCFFDCHIFKFKNQLSRNYVVWLYDQAIKRYKTILTGRNT